MPSIHLILALAIAVAVALAFLPALRLSYRARLGAFLAAFLVMSVTPWLIPQDRWIERALVAGWGGGLLVKLWDLHRGVVAGHRAPLRTLLIYMANPLSYCLRRLGDEPRPTMAQNLRWGLICILLSAGGILALRETVRADLDPVSRHLCIIATLFAAMVGLYGLIATLWRLGGGTTLDMFGNCLTAPTPAEFWRRWNMPTYQWFHENVFIPCGGRRRPLRAAAVVFLVSALAHEYLATILNGRVEGYQFAFFALQGVVVLATWRLRPEGWAVVPAIGATLAFNLASAAVFMKSMPG